MPDYGEILSFLAANPPQLAAERELHASLLELIAKCLRSERCSPRRMRFRRKICRRAGIRWMDVN